MICSSMRRWQRLNGSSLHTYTRAVGRALFSNRSHYLTISLALMRLYARLGVRYLTHTHTCHTSFASSAGDGSFIRAVHPHNGLSELGRELIVKLNRLGVMIDLSHVSDATMEVCCSSFVSFQSNLLNLSA
jgi:microsomal dipeptidase-like Zn-dependent dipeptidase